MKMKLSSRVKTVAWSVFTVFFLQFVWNNPGLSIFLAFVGLWAKTGLYLTRVEFRKYKTRKASFENYFFGALAGPLYLSVFSSKRYASMKRDIDRFTSNTFGARYKFRSPIVKVEKTETKDVNETVVPESTEVGGNTEVNIKVDKVDPNAGLTGVV